MKATSANWKPFRTSFAFAFSGVVLGKAHHSHPSENVALFAQASCSSFDGTLMLQAAANVRVGLNDHPDMGVRTIRKFLTKLLYQGTVKDNRL